MDEVSAEAASPALSPPRKVRGKPARHARGRFPWLTVVLSVIAVILAVATGALTWQVHDQAVTASQRTAVLAAARQEALDLTTLSDKTGGTDYQAVLSGSAGNLKQELADGRDDFLKALSSDAVTSVGQVLDAGIVNMSGANATVLLNVASTVTNKQTSKPETRLYHWQAALVRSGGRWLVTSLEFV
jgi:Mce-associated membrane protein